MYQGFTQSYHIDIHVVRSAHSRRIMISCSYVRVALGIGLARVRDVRTRGLICSYSYACSIRSVCNGPHSALCAHGGVWLVLPPIAKMSFFEMRVYRT
jgi:hypothetical protein